MVDVVPVKDCRQGAPRKLSLDDSAIDFDGDLAFFVLSVKMGRRVVAVLHPDHDAKESTNLRHSAQSPHPITPSDTVREQTE